MAIESVAISRHLKVIMKFRIFFGIFALFFIKLMASPSQLLSYNNCRFVDNTSVELFCDRVKVNHSINDCYSIFLNLSSMELNRPQVDLLKFNDCGTDSKHINISSSFFNRFPKLRVLDISNLTIKSLYINFFDTNNSLEIINASRNDLKELPKTTFNRMPNLMTVDFSHNKIKMINSKIFEGAIKLTMINLSNNNLIILANEAFSSLENLEFLDLSANQIRTIDNNLFVNNGKLRSLNLNGNPVMRFNFNAFSPLDNELQVQVPWKQIESLHINCRNIYYHFKNLDRRNTFENLRIFNISGCRDRKFMGFLDKLGANVEILDLSYNFIQQLTVDIFERFTKLQSIYLSHTNLSNIGFDTFSYQTRLISLDLGYNNLSNLTIFSRKFFHLEVLNLEGNQLKSAIDNVTLMNFPNLNWLAISKNQFPCDYLVQFLKRWANVEKLQLLNNPSRYQMNIEGIDCYTSPLDSNRNEKSFKNVTNRKYEHKNIFRNITNDKCTDEKSMQICIIGTLLFIILLNFITIAAMCWSSKRKRCNRRDEITNQIQMTERKIEKVTQKRRTNVQETENQYEEIGFRNSHTNQSLYDVPRFNTMQKSYL